MDEKEQEMWLPGEEPEASSTLGNCLRASFTADNHDSLGDDIARSMLHLSHEAKTGTMRARLVRR